MNEVLLNKQGTKSNPWSVRIGYRNNTAAVWHFKTRREALNFIGQQARTV